MATLDTIMTAMSAGTYRYTTEVELHHGLEAAMRAAGLDPHPEVAITGGRIDFLVDKVGVEVKVRGTLEALIRQVHRYAKSPDVDAFLVVTTRVAHRSLPTMIGGKPVKLLTLGGAL